MLKQNKVMNEDILKASGGTWASPPKTLKLSNAFRSLRDNILEPLLTGDAPWIVKDERRITLGGNNHTIRLNGIITINMIRITSLYV